jgi:hypothetical protein
MMFQPELLQEFYQHGRQINRGIDRSAYIYDSETAVSSRTSENCMPSVLTITAQVMEIAVHELTYKT